MPLFGFDLVADFTRFVLAAPYACDDDFFPDGVFTSGGGVQSLAQTVDVVGNQPRCRCQNVRRRTVVAFQPNQSRVRKILLKAQNVADFRPAPRVNRLIVVADTAQVVMIPRQQTKPEILNNVGVLVFVNQNIAELPLKSFQHIGIFLEQFDAIQQ